MDLAEHAAGAAGAATRARPDRALLALGGAVVMAAAILRAVGMGRHQLWYDELLSANFSAHGPLAALLASRFDPHPPLYYLQLSLWALQAQGDGWLMANSILWSTLAVLALMLAAGRLYGARVGLAAGALLAVSPAAIAYGDQVRMYPFICALIVGAWYAQSRWLERSGTWRLVGLAVLELCIAWSHSVGLLMLSGLVILGAVETLRTGERRRMLAWTGAQAAVGAFSLPVLAIAAIHSVGHTHAPDARTIFDTWSFLATGTGGAEPWRAGLGPEPWRDGLALAVLALLAYAAVAMPRLRLQILTLVFTPLLLAALVSYALKPIWLQRIFVPITPFLAVVLARLAAEARPAAPGAWARAAAVGALGALWLAIGACDQTTRPKGDGWAATATLVQSTARPGDVVVMSDPLGFWSLMWRLDGPRWGDPLRTHLPDPPHWTPLLAKLPAAVRERLRPGVLSLPIGVETAVLQDAAAAAPLTAGDLIIVSTPFEPSPVPRNRQLVARRVLDQVVVERWRRAGAGAH